MNNKFIYLSVASLIACGCGGGGATGGAETGGSESMFGPVRATSTGTPRTPIVMTGSGAVVTGVSGASFSEVIVKLPNPTQENQREVLAQTKIAFSSGMRAHTYDWATGQVNDLSPDLPFFNEASGASMSGLGDKVASAEWDYSTNRIQLYVSNIDGTGRVKIPTGTFSAYHPSFSPDGKTIVYERLETGVTNRRIFAVPSVGGTPTALTDGSTDDIRPEWSNDGTKIAFIRQSGGTASIWTMNANGTGKTQVSASLNYLSVDWSPDGRELITIYYDGTYFHLSRLLPSVGYATIYSATQEIESATWSPDGSLIAFGASSSGFFDLFTIPAKGGTPTQLTSNQNSRGPSWGPYVQQRKFVGTAGVLGASSAGFLFSQSGDFVKSIVSFDAVTRSGVTIVPAQDHSDGQPNIVCTIKATDKLKSLSFVNSFTGSPTNVIVPTNTATHAQGAIVSFNAATGKVASVLPYRSTATATVREKREGGALRLSGDFLGVWDGNGENLSPGGAREVTIDLSTGKATFR